MNANDPDPISAAIKTSREKKQAEINKAKQIANTSEQNLCKVAEKATNAITGALNKNDFFGGQAHGLHEASITEDGQPSREITICAPGKLGISVTAKAQVNGDRIGGLNVMVIGPNGTASFQEPFQGHYSVDPASLAHKITQAAIEAGG